VGAFTGLITEVAREGKYGQDAWFLCLLIKHDRDVYRPEYAGGGCDLVFVSYIGKLRGVVLALSGRPVLTLSLETCSTLAMLFLSRLSEYNGCVLACALITRYLKISK
jgi:hypothetical protein